MDKFLMGLGLGVAAGLLFAPKSGEQTRGYLRSKANEGTDYLKRRSEEMADRAGDLVDRGMEAVRSQSGPVAEAGERLYGSR